MHTAIRKYRVMDPEAFIRKVEEEFVQRVEAVEGFVGYYAVDGGDGTATTITVAETEHGVQLSNERADVWVVQRAAHLVEGAPDVTIGEVRVRVQRSPRIHAPAVSSRASGPAKANEATR